MSHPQAEFFPAHIQEKIADIESPMDLIHFGLEIRETLNRMYRLERERAFGLILSFPTGTGQLFIDHRADQIARGPSTHLIQDLLHETGATTYIPLTEALDLIDGLEE